MFPLPFNIPFRKKDGTLSTLGDELNNGGGGGSSYTLPTASADVKGGVKIGEGLTMDGEVLKNTNPTPTTPYQLPVATDETLGGVKVGSGLSILDGVLSATGGGGGSDIYYNDYNFGVGTSTEIVADKLYSYEINLSRNNNFSTTYIAGYKPIGILPIDLNTGYKYWISPILWNSNNYKTVDDFQTIEILTPRSSISNNSLRLRVLYVKDDNYKAIPTS